MVKIYRKYKKYIFMILVLLSLSNFSIIVQKNDTSILKKIIFIGLNIIYIYIITEYIELFIYHKILESVLNCKCFTSIFTSKLFLKVLPLFSLIVYTFTWYLYIADSIIDTYISNILVLMSISIISFFMQLKDDFVYVNNDNIFKYNIIIAFNSIKTVNLDKKDNIGKTERFKVTLNSKEEYYIKIDKKHTREFLDIIELNQKK